ncbi:hypothetical protein [Micromonospora craterilacus]|uniref:hypothetical protein n=1 Tax=Micromonospora craterilacus TaxID=1655439 RepID=UPI001F47B174|nr:hypothetical protein [Micromonospora craterilacus]
MTSHNTDPREDSHTTANGGDVWTEERIRALGAITDLPTAGRIFGLGRALSYELARTGDFPVPVIRASTRYKVPVAGILTSLGLQPSRSDLTPGDMRSVDHHHEIRSIDPPHSGGDGKKEP